MPTLKVIYKTTDYFYEQTGHKKYRDGQALHAVIRYCLNPMKTPSGIVGGMGVDVDQAAFEMERISSAYGREFGVRLRHFMLSFSQDEVLAMGSCDLEIMKEIAEFVACCYGHSHQIIYALHEDTETPHLHFVMNAVSYLDGRKFSFDFRDQRNLQDVLGKYLMETHGFKLVCVPDYGDFHHNQYNYIGRF